MNDQRKMLTSVYVADDHPVFRTGIVRLLEDSGLEVVGQGKDGRSALHDIKHLRPQVAVLDVQMPELDGVRVLEALKMERVETRVVLLSGFFASENVYEAVTCGVAGLVTKTSGVESIVSAVNAAARGETEISPELMGGFTMEVRRHQGNDGTSLLSDREIDILRLMAAGKSRRDMATDLALSQATVKYHLGNLYAKLDVGHATAAVAEGWRRGILE